MGHILRGRLFGPEVEVAERLVDIIPCAETVRFLKTGGEAMAATHRLARAFTGRDHILTCGYHGWINNMDRLGVPAAMSSVYRALPWGDIEPFEAAFADIGASITTRAAPSARSSGSVHE